MQGLRQADMALGEVACVIGLGLIGQLLVQLLRANGVRVVGIDISRGAVRAGRGAGCRVRGGSRGRGPRARRRRPGRADRRLRRRRGVPERRGRHQHPCRAGRPPGPRPRPGGRHRQVLARPALERVLREGARRPVLPLVRARSLRPDLRGAGRRLPGRLRALDGGPQPGLLRRPARSGPDRAGPARSPPSRRSTPRRRPTSSSTRASSGASASSSSTRPRWR